MHFLRSLHGGLLGYGFMHVMSNMQRYVAGEDDTLITHVDSAWTTMAIVEACYRSAARPCEPVPSLPALEEVA